MPFDKAFGDVANLIAEPSRAGILTALMGGKALTAGEIARLTNISAQVASNQLKKLQAAKLVVLAQSVGRLRYYQLASEEVAQTLESLSLLSISPKDLFL